MSPKTNPNRIVQSHLRLSAMAISPSAALTASPSARTAPLSRQSRNKCIAFEQAAMSGSLRLFGSFTNAWFRLSRGDSRERRCSTWSGYIYISNEPNAFILIAFPTNRSKLGNLHFLKSIKAHHSESALSIHPPWPPLLPQWR